jgi:uncharacterized protein YuzE
MMGEQDENSSIQPEAAAKARAIAIEQDEPSGANANANPDSDSSSSSEPAVAIAVEQPADDSTALTEDLAIEIEETGDVVPSPLKPITERQLRKARRTRNALVTMIVIGIVALAAIILLGYMVFSPNIKPDSNQNTTVVPPNVIDTTTVVDQQAPAKPEYEKTTIPELVGLYGLTLDEVKTKLGAGFILDPLSSDGVYTFRYEPIIINQSSTGSTSNSSSKQPTLVDCSINLDFDEDGKVVDVVFLSDLRLLDYPDKSFAEFVGTNDVVLQALKSAGVTPADEAALNPEEITQYDNELSENRKIMYQSKTYHGSSTASEGMNKWDVVIKYDYGTGVVTADEYENATKTIRIKLYR